MIFMMLLSGKDVISLENAGISGNTSGDLFARLASDVMNKKPDLVILMVGTNDMVNSRAMLSYREYGDNLRLITKKLKDSNIDVVLVSPPPVDTTYLFKRHEKDTFSEMPNQKLKKASQISSEIARENGVYFVDLFGEFIAMNLPQHNEDPYIQNPKNSGLKDGVHMTDKGYKLIAETIFKALTENELLHEGMKIICFGDSLTYGVRVEGAGTSAGQTYPAYLLSMIEEHFD